MLEPKMGPRIWQNLRTGYTPLLLVSTALAFTPLRFISFLIICYAVSRLLWIRAGLISKLVLAFIIIASISCCVAGAAWLVKLPLSSALVLSLYNGLLLLILLISRDSFQSLFPSSSEFSDGYDWASLVLTAATFALLIFPVASRFNATTLLPVIAAGGDNSSHIELIKTNDLNRGYSIGLSNHINPPRNLLSYPQGWHFNEAFMKWLVEVAVPFNQSISKLLAFYYITICLWFCLLIFVAVRLSFEIQTPAATSGQFLAKLAVLFVCGSVIAGWLIPLFVDGFQTEIAALTLFAAELFVLVEAYYRANRSRYSYLAVAALLVAGISYMWLFLAPVAMAILLLCVVQTLVKLKRLPSLWVTFLALLVTLSAGLQIVVQLLFKTGTSNSAVNARGFIQPTAMYALIAVFAVISLYAYVRSSNTKIRLVYLASGVALSFSLLLMVYQLHTIHELRYYYYKSTYTFIFVAMVLLGSIGYEAMSSVVSNRSRPKLPPKLHLIFMIITTAALSSIVFWSLKSVSFDDLLHKRLGGISSAQAGTTAGVLGVNPLDGYRIVFIGSCNRGDDIRASLFAQSLAYAPRSSVQLVASFKLSPLSKEHLFKEINTFVASSHEHIIVASSDQVISNELTNYLGNNSQFIRLINLDSTPQTEPIAQCPDRIRTLTPEEVKAIDGDIY